VVTTVEKGADEPEDEGDADDGDADDADADEEGEGGGGVDGCLIPSFVGKKEEMITFF